MLGRPSILLVDDDHDLVDVLAMALEDAGFDVRCAFDGEQGLQAVADDPPELVVADVVMPRLDGLGLAIAQTVARAHGGRIRLLGDGPLPGAAFEVRLPTV